MDIGSLSVGYLALFAIVLLAAGGCAGVLAGLLGVGGGIVIVPVLFHLFTSLGVDEAVRMHVAVGTSLATIIPTSIRSVMSHRKKDSVDFSILKQWSLAILLGVIVGSFIAIFATGRVLTLVFALVALVVSIHMAFGKEEWRIAKMPERGIFMNATAGLLGTFSTLMGIGGGTLGVPIMTLFGIPIHRAVGTAAGIGLLVSVPGTIGFVIAGFGEPLRPPFSFGYVNLLGFALIVPMTVFAAPLGVRLAHWLDRATLRRVFAVFLALTSFRMMLGLWG